MRRAAVLCWAALAPVLTAAGPTLASPVLDRLHTEGVLHCGGVIRPGLAFPARDGTWHGLEVDLCQAIAVAALGPPGRSLFHGYTDVAASFDGVRRGDDEVAFLTASEVLAQNLLGVVLPGPPVFFTASGVMVHAGSPATRLADLRDHRICVEPGTGSERLLRAWFAAQAVPARFVPFQEAEEMQDGFYSRHCDAIVGELPRLAALRLQADADGHPARLLPDAVGADPILMVTPLGDSQWSAAAAWAIATLQRAETQDPDALPLPGAALALPQGWQAAMLAATGSYADIYRRNLGTDSPLNLPRGLNALSTAGGLFCPPFTE